MSDSILQVNQIKDKGGNATGITVADTTANISIGTTLAVNTINEVTSANGVTIDGLSLKDGNVVPAAGKGIDFSAASGSASGSTGALLDDYEEGTWTPTISGASIISNNFINGEYVKVGNVVSIFAVFDNVELGSVSGYSYITGFPFTAGFNSVGHSAHNTMCTPSQFYIGNGNTSALITADNSTGTITAWNAGSGKYMIFQATYRTT